MATQTQVLIAHTGQRLPVDISQFSSLDDFKGWVARQSSIPVQNIVALTSQGKTVKIQTIQSEKEIYVYDIRITQISSSGSSTSLVSESPLPKRYVASSAPNSIDDTHSLRSWQDLFRKRRDWALTLVEDCTAMATAAEARYGELDVMLKCLDAAVANLDTALKPIEPKYSELKKWAAPAQEEYATLTANWESYVELARNISISPTMVRFMTGQDVRKSRQATLEDLIDPDPTRKAGKLAATSLRKFNSKISDLDQVADKMFTSCDVLFQEFDKLVARSAIQHSHDCRQLLEDIEAVARKIDTDYQTTLQYTNQAKDIPQASKTAANHTKHLLPSLQNRASEMYDMLLYATKSRNDVAADSLGFMRSVAEITSLHHSVKTQMSLVNQGEEEMTTFDYLRLIQQLPFMYASFAVEAVRRREWAEKVKTDSSTLVNEMALFQEEELKRRRKWQKMVGSTYGPEKNENHVLGLEVNLLGEEEPWPAITKQDLVDYLTLIRQHNVDTVIVEDVAKLINELNNPTKQQSKRLKAFKNGSVHEAVLGRSGLLIRGDDDLLRSLQGDKSRLESRVKTAESRVRRLEDLLHRQTQTSRPSLFQAQQQSERTDSMSSTKTARPPDDHRRSSISENKGDLNAQKERSAALEKEANAHAEHMKDHLLGNMEALKREFMEERKLLEDEIEHFGESRENEKFTYDEKLHSLEDEIDRLRNEKREEALKTQGQVEFLRNETRVQRERNVSLERELREARETIKESTETHARSLRELHGQLSPSESSPQDFADLMDAVTTKSADILAKFQSLEQDLSLMKSDLEHAQGTVKELSETELASARCSTLEAELRLKMTEDEEKKQSQVGSLEEEVRMFQDKLQSTESTLGDVNSRFEGRNYRTKDITQQRLGFSKIPRSERTSQNPNDSSDPGNTVRRSASTTGNLLTDSADLSTEEEQYQAFMAGPGNFDIDAFSETIYRRMTRDARSYRERFHVLAKEAHEKIAFKHFKEGDLALFLPTRNQTTGAWAAFNEGHRLRSREWLVARITRIQERVVDLSKSLQSPNLPPGSETDSVNTDGLRWWLIDAHEDKPGAPSTPGLAMADMHAHGRSGKSRSKIGSNGGIEGVSRTLTKNLESRRSSSGSKKALPALASETNSARGVAVESPIEGPSLTGPSETQGESAAKAEADQQALASAAAGGKTATGDPDEVRRAVDNLLGP
ncbi:autophagy-related protein 11-domain-containing protein [Biscogniauxia marginata]|nr:autophagy-related protein 11-domain-containing protein [Biscogniauxia marginata]